MEWIIKTLNDEWSALGILFIGTIIIFIGLAVQDAITKFIEQLFKK